MHNKVIDAEFTSVWDGGTTVTTGCQVDLDTGEVFNIKTSSAPADNLNELDEEYISFGGNTYSVVRFDGTEYDVVHPGEFWYW